MKTVQQIKEEVNSLIENHKEKERKAATSKKKVPSIKSKLDFLKMCRLYLETNPSPEFLKSEVKRMEDIVSSKESQFKEWTVPHELKSQSINKQKAAFFREVGVSDIKKRIKTVKYLLS